MTATARAYDEERRDLQDRLRAMAGRCQRLADRAVDALRADDAGAARALLPLDSDIDRDEREADAITARMFAIRQPVGRDLRFLRSALEITKTLERVGDESIRVAESVDEMHGAIVPRADLADLGNTALAMLREALDCFIDGDVEAARAILDRDQAIAERSRRMLRAAIGSPAPTSERPETAVLTVACARHLERIADHAATIAKMVIYLERPDDMRHRPSLKKVAR